MLRDWFPVFDHCTQLASSFVRMHTLFSLCALPCPPIHSWRLNWLMVQVNQPGSFKTGFLTAFDVLMHKSKRVACISKYVSWVTLSEESRLGVSLPNYTLRKDLGGFLLFFFFYIYSIVTIIIQHSMYWKHISTSEWNSSLYSSTGIDNIAYY